MSKKKTPSKKSTTKKPASKKAPFKPRLFAGESYLFYIKLSSTDNPTITRTICVPADFTFEEFAEAINISFGWTGMQRRHFHFTSLVEYDEESKTMMGGKFVISVAEEGGTLKDLGVERDNQADWLESEHTLHEVWGNREKWGKLECEYEYSASKSWMHRVICMGKVDHVAKASFGASENTPVLCIAGEGHPAFEGVCSCDWEGLKYDLMHPDDKDDDNRDRREWYKEDCAYMFPEKVENFDPYRWEILDVNDDLIATFGEGYLEPREVEWTTIRCNERREYCENLN